MKKKKEEFFIICESCSSNKECIAPSKGIWGSNRKEHIERCNHYEAQSCNA